MGETSVITLLEAVDKRVRITSTGGEIVTTFYVEPASAAPDIVCALLGNVSGDGIQGGAETTQKYARQLPAHDCDYSFYYCVEAHPTPFDRRSVTNSPALLARQFGGAAVQPSDIATALAQPIIFDGPSSTDASGVLTNQKAPNMCGAYVEAVYRPLMTIYSGPIAEQSDLQNVFDYIDPQFYPCSRTFPINGVAGRADSFLLTVLGVPTQYGGMSSLMATETWQEFTIRRVMCPSVPWMTIQQLTGRINGQSPWAPANMKVPGLPFNTFPQGTLRFDSAEPIMRTVPRHFTSDPTKFSLDAGGLPYTFPMNWWDITYKFSWRTTYATWKSYDGTEQGPWYITWNCDWYAGYNAGVFASIYNVLPGWVEMTFQQETNSVVSFDTRRKYLDAEDTKLPINQPGHVWTGHPFDQLFLLQAP